MQKPSLLFEAPIGTVGKSFETFVYQEIVLHTIGKRVRWEIASDINESSYIVNRKCPLRSMRGKLHQLF